ncbi:MAG TPA: class I SAM-dependent methyltransferase [Gaiellaceae bacterium]|nr:class I SAM-dependent methyltransferase [Gaiellaceae bacterium]
MDDDPRQEAEELRAPSPVEAGARGLRRRLQYAAAAPLAAGQRTFNGVLLRLFDALSSRVDDVAARSLAAERRVAELEERLLRLERRPAAPAPETVAPQPRASALPDYFAFESRLRGSTAEVRERQRPYVERLRGHAPVLDVGSGRGELLALLREAGIDARGVDANADMVAFARGEGLEVEQASAHEALNGAADGSLGAVTALQVAEHLPPSDLVALLRLAHAKLRPGGLLVLETINPASVAALRNYFADLTHAQPLVPETLELLVRSAGFRETEIVYLDQPERPAEALDYAIFAVC